MMHRLVPAGRKPVEIDGEPDDHQQPEPEMRHGQADERDGRRRVVARLAAPDRGDHPRRDPDQDRHEHAEQRELEADRDARDDRVRDRQLSLVAAEVAVQREPDPVAVLHGQRPVEEVLVAHGREHGGVAILGTERDRRITGNRADAQEDEHARQHEDDEGGSRLSEKEAAHRRFASSRPAATCTARTRPGAACPGTASRPAAAWRGPPS